MNRLKPLAGVDKAFWAVKISVPAKLFRLLHGKAGGPYASAHERRLAFFEEYEEFMRSIPREYGMFDIFRWRDRGNWKWHFIVGLNRLFWSKCSS